MAIIGLSKQEAIEQYRKEGKPLYMISIDRHIEELDIHDKDWLWFLYDDLNDLKTRMRALMAEIREYPGFQELDRVETKDTIAWDVQYIDQITSELVRFTFLAEPV